MLLDTIHNSQLMILKGVSENYMGRNSRRGMMNRLF